MTDGPPLDAEPIIAVFNTRGVDYVVIGAFAARAYDAPVPPTLDIDFTPSTTPANLKRLADALRELGARIRTAQVPGGVPFDPDPGLIASMAMLNLTCRHGDFDLAFHPSGTGGFDDLAQRATTVLIGDTEARVADLADVIRSKQAAARPKDLKVLPALERYAKSRGIDLGATSAVAKPEASDPEASDPEASRPTSREGARQRLRELGGEPRRPGRDRSS